eukprot:CAMPEP_0195582842 /NCGR_PEP_ID=MMETSP0814-20130614/22951_1 /TAXON_ID=97485 /ORGANISM="Prymnesium parvum, Strain Texoma1" /LENGTH=30 /DNA_ID= /DNA_START= /DNA_END= /DNA_ORIENTATION=
MLNPAVPDEQPAYGAMHAGGGGAYPPGMLM